LPRQKLNVVLKLEVTAENRKTETVETREYLRSNILNIKYSPNSTWLVTSRHVLTRHDTFDVLSASSRACRAVLFDKLARHGQNASARHVETWRASAIWAYV